MVEEFIFPASKIVIQCRRSPKADLPSDQAIPVCSTPLTVTAAFELLVALCTGCVQNLKILAEMLTEMYYTSKCHRNLAGKLFCPYSFLLRKRVTCVKRRWCEHDG